MSNRKPMTEEQRTKHNSYQRKYRAEHPDLVRQWQNAYLIRKAHKLENELINAQIYGEGGEAE